jgi:hypothetical protein
VPGSLRNHAHELAGNAPDLTERGYLGQVPVDLDERILGEYPDHRRTRDHRVAQEELATHHDSSSVDFLNLKDPDMVLESAALQLLDPRAKTFVALVRAAGASGSGWMKLDLRVRDRDKSLRVTPVERFSEPTSKRLGQGFRHHLQTSLALARPGFEWWSPLDLLTVPDVPVISNHPDIAGHPALLSFAHCESEHLCRGTSHTPLTRACTGHPTHTLASLGEAGA